LFKIFLSFHSIKILYFLFIHKLFSTTQIIILLSQIPIYLVTQILLLILLYEGGMDEVPIV